MDVVEEIYQNLVFILTSLSFPYIQSLYLYKVHANIRLTLIDMYVNLNNIVFKSFLNFPDVHWLRETTVVWLGLERQAEY